MQGLVGRRAGEPPRTRMIAEQSDGTECDRAGRVVVEPDLTVKGHPNVFVIGDLMSVPGVPGQAQGAIQGAGYATKQIKGGLKGDDPATRKPFKYFDKGSMATISRFNAVCQGRQARVRRVPRLARVARPAPLLPCRRPQPPHRRHLVVRHLPRQRARPDGDHRAVGVRTQGDGPSPGAADPEGHRVTCARIWCAHALAKCATNRL